MNDAQEIANRIALLYNPMPDMSGRQINRLHGRQRQLVEDLAKDIADEAAEIERRRKGITAAVALCMNDDHLTDLGTLKRAWFFSETGRDEPVGSRSWEELRAMVREHCGCPLPAPATPKEETPCR